MRAVPGRAAQRGELQRERLEARARARDAIELPDVVHRVIPRAQQTQRGEPGEVGEVADSVSGDVQALDVQAHRARDVGVDLGDAPLDDGDATLGRVVRAGVVAEDLGEPHGAVEVEPRAHAERRARGDRGDAGRGRGG